MSEVWTKWQGHVIDGTYPLHRYLGGSDHSGVFLSEVTGWKTPEVAITLVPVGTSLAESYLKHWELAAGLEHPHLMRIFRGGRCELAGTQLVYAVLEYSDQNLGQLLEHRAMTEEEAREMLPPVLAALGFLHNRNLIQGQLKPTNILVVGDQIKLATDTVRGVGEIMGAGNMVSVYDPPEVSDGIRLGGGRHMGAGRQFVRSPHPQSLVGTGCSPGWRSAAAGLLADLPRDRRVVSEPQAVRPAQDQ